MKQENDFVLPEKWAVKINNILQKELKYYSAQGYHHSNNEWDIKVMNDFELITFEEYQQHVLKEITKPEYEPKDVAFNNYEQIKGALMPFNGSFEEWNSKFNPSIELKSVSDLEEIKRKKIIGYKLIKPEYKEAFSKLIDIDIEYIKTQKKTPYHFSDNCEGFYKLKRLNVLDIWCEPVYDTSITLKSGVKLSEDDIAEVKEMLNNK